MPFYQIVHWIEAAEAAFEGKSLQSFISRRVSRKKGFYFTDEARYDGTAKVVTFDFETLKENIQLLDRMIHAAAHVVLSENVKVDLFRRFEKLKSEDPAVIVASLRRVEASLKMPARMQAEIGMSLH